VRVRLRLCLLNYTFVFYNHSIYVCKLTTVFLSKIVSHIKVLDVVGEANYVLSLRKEFRKVFVSSEKLLNFQREASFNYLIHHADRIQFP
jgi:hypothetical protein